MKNISYQELKQKYLSLVDENRSLRARIRELESGKGSISREHLIREPINPDPGRGTDISPNARIIPGQIRINHYAAPDQKSTLFMSLFKGRTDLYVKNGRTKKENPGSVRFASMNGGPGSATNPGVNVLSAAINPTRL